MGKFRQILEELSARDTSIFLFPDDNLRKYQGILTKLGTCIDIKFCFGIANGQFLSIFKLSAHNTIMKGYYHFMFLFLFFNAHLLFSLVAMVTIIFEVEPFNYIF